MTEQPQDAQPIQAPANVESNPANPPQPDLPTPEAQMAPKPRRKQLFILAGAILAVIILAGAAFLAGSLMNNKNISAGNGPVAQSNGSGGRVVQSLNESQITPAPELPIIQADVRGVFLSRTNDSFTIGTGGVGLTIQGNGSGQISTPQVSYDGPTYEVVITKDTVLYKDTTQLDPGNNGPIQQTVAPGTLDDLNSTIMVSVWGKKTGDRYIADVIVYLQPMTKLVGGNGGTLK